MFTGLNPNIHGVNTTYSDSLSKNIPFLPEILQKNGYMTLFVLPGADPALPLQNVYNRGINTVFYEGQNDWYQALQSFTVNVNQNKKTFLFLHTYDVHEPYLIGYSPKFYTTEQYPNIPLTGEDYNRTSKESYQKLYIEVQKALKSNTDPLADVVMKEALSIMVKNNYDPQLLDSELLYNSKYSPFLWASWDNVKYNNAFDIHSPRDVNYLRALYDQRINQMDESKISTLIQFLSSNVHIKNSTIVIFTADHGEEFMEHGSIYHQTIYDSNLHIPLIFYIPGITKPEQISTPVQLTDLAPTILDMVGIAYQNEFQGSSLVGEIEGKPLPDRLIISDGWDLDTMVIRNKQWKLHVKRNADSTFTPYELYDIQKDPNEKQNVLFSHLNIAKEFVSKYEFYERIWRVKMDAGLLLNQN